MADLNNCKGYYVWSEKTFRASESFLDRLNKRLLPPMEELPTMVYAPYMPLYRTPCEIDSSSGTYSGSITVELTPEQQKSLEDVWSKFKVGSEPHLPHPAFINGGGRSTFGMTPEQQLVHFKQRIDAQIDNSLENYLFRDDTEEFRSEVYDTLTNYLIDLDKSVPSKSQMSTWYPVAGSEVGVIESVEPKQKNGSECKKCSGIVGRASGIDACYCG